MKTSRRAIPNLSGLRASGALRSDNLIRIERMDSRELPLVVRPNAASLDLVTWAASHRELVQSLLVSNGALLFRGFSIADLSKFERFMMAVSGEPLRYTEQTSPRALLHGNIYTSTDYPPQHRIFLHNESSYSSTWPLKIAFFCATPAAIGGETPIADVRRVRIHIPEPVYRRFSEKGWMLVRNFGTGFGLSWQTAFQTNDPEEVNRHCEARGAQYEWLSQERLRIRQRRSPLARHPATNELLWFNHATFFHISTLEPEVRSQLLAEFREEDLPYNSYYGDGTAIEPDTMDLLRKAYERELVSFAWQKRDILLLDNMTVAHGRAPFSGARRIAVAMAEPYSGE